MWLGLGTPLTGRQGLVSALQKLSCEMEGWSGSWVGLARAGCTPREDVGELCSREWSRGPWQGKPGERERLGGLAAPRVALRYLDGHRLCLRCQPAGFQEPLLSQNTTLINTSQILETVANTLKNSMNCVHKNSTCRDQS